MRYHEIQATHHPSPARHLAPREEVTDITRDDLEYEGLGLQVAQLVALLGSWVPRLVSWALGLLWT